jgi:uncharacterized protein
MESRDNAAPVELSQQECLELLRSGVVGRVAVVTPDGPRIQPVNYAVHGNSVVFRTAAYSELARYGRNAELAFEIDHLDYETHLGWSVVAVGTARVVDDADEVADIRESWDPRPWASGTRNLYLRITWRTLTGRRLGRDWSPTSEMRYRRTV